jgi:Bacterial Ig-like domain
MKHWQFATFAALALILSACPGGGDTTKPTVDTTAPTIISTTPANNGTGVLATDNIVITFSEPMNKSVTQSAYQAATTRIRPIEVQFTWNDAGTVLTVDPNVSLLIAAGADPATVTAVPYAFQITNLATDLAGNALTSASFSFTTQRRITQNLPGLASLSGAVRATDGVTACSGSRPCAGDSGSGGNLQWKGFISFDITGIPAGVQSFEFANLNLNQVSTFKDGVAGDPYGDLGGAVSLEHVNFDTMNLAAAFNPAALSTVGNISSNATLELKTLSVLAQVQNDYSNRVARGQRSQYRIVFPTVTDIDIKFDAAIFETPTAATNPSTLTVRYLLP